MAAGAPIDDESPIQDMSFDSSIMADLNDQLNRDNVPIPNQMGYPQGPLQNTSVQNDRQKDYMEATPKLYR